MAKLICPECGVRFALPVNGKNAITCPKCRSKFSPVGPSESDAAAPAVAPEAPKPSPTQEQGEAFLKPCPVCGGGEVVSQPGGDAVRFACTRCTSVLEETTFGYTYVAVDPAYQEDKGDLLHDTLTRDDLDLLVQEAGGMMDSERTDFVGGQPVRMERVAEVLGEPAAAKTPASSGETAEPAKPAGQPQAEPAGEPRPDPAPTPAAKTPVKKAAPAPAETDMLDDILAAEAAGGPAQPPGAKQEAPGGKDKVLMWQVDEEPAPAPAPQKPAKAKGKATAKRRSKRTARRAPAGESDPALATVPSRIPTPAPQPPSSAELPAVAAPAAKARPPAPAPAPAAPVAADTALASAGLSVANVVQMLAIVLAALCVLRTAQAVHESLSASNSLTIEAVAGGCKNWASDLTAEAKSRGPFGRVLSASRQLVGRNRETYQRFGLFVIVLMLAGRLAVCARVWDYLYRLSPTRAERTVSGTTSSLYLLLVYAATVYGVGLAAGDKVPSAGPLMLTATLVVSALWLLQAHSQTPKVERKQLASLPVWCMSNLLFAALICIAARGFSLWGWRLLDHYQPVESAILLLWVNGLVNFQLGSTNLGRAGTGEEGNRLPATVTGVLVGIIAAAGFYS